MHRIRVGVVKENDNGSEDWKNGKGISQRNWTKKRGANRTGVMKREKEIKKVKEERTKDRYSED